MPFFVVPASCSSYCMRSLQRSLRECVSVRCYRARSDGHGIVASTYRTERRRWGLDGQCSNRARRERVHMAETWSNQQRSQVRAPSCLSKRRRILHGHFQADGKRAQGYAGFQCGERKVLEDNNMEDVQSLARQTESEIPTTSCKVVVDINTTTFEPGLQSMVRMPMKPTTPEDLNDLLKCPEG